MPNDASILAALWFILVALCLIALILIAMYFKPSSGTSPKAIADIDNAIKSLDATIGHHVQVSAVLAMVKQIEEGDPNAVKLLKLYPEQVRAAAWLYTINKLGVDIKAETDKLSGAHKTFGANHPYTKDVQASLDAMYTKLGAATAASGQRGLHVV